ncbi:MAG: LysR family transcriptional regulator [Firmicutes bacterium]|nr:LysR family transcriptional regulator [Bacillota bacterium]
MSAAFDVFAFFLYNFNREDRFALKRGQPKEGIKMFGITLQQLEIFLAVVHCQSMSHAARELYLSQPAVSTWIQKLEDTLGTKLFIRSHKGIILTPEGLRLYAELDPIYQRFRVSLEQVLRNNMKGKKDSLNIGCFHEPAIMELMRRTTSLFQEQYPETSVYCELYNFQELREKLICSELDVIFTFSFEVCDNPEISYKRLGDLDLYFLLPSSWHVPANCKDYRFLREKTMLLEINKGHDLLLSVCDAHGFKPAKVKYVSSLLLIFYMIAEGEGFTIAGPHLPVNDYFNDNIDILPIADDAYRQKIHVVAAWRKEEDNPLVKQYVSILAQPDCFMPAAPKPQDFVKSNWYRNKRKTAGKRKL